MFAYFTLFIIGFFIGLPMLINSTIIGVWFKLHGLSNTKIGLTSIGQIPFILSFLWAPIVESKRIPFLFKKFGRNIGWGLFSHILMFLSFLLLSFSDPKDNLWLIIFASSLLSLGAGIHDIVLYAYQAHYRTIYSVNKIVPIITFGCRIGMLAASTGSLFIADLFGWNFAFICLSSTIIIASILLLYHNDPTSDTEDKDIRQAFQDRLILPIKTIMSHPLSNKIFGVILTFKLSDSLIHKMVKPMYIEIGFTIKEIAIIVQTYGIFASIFGGFIGAYTSKISGAMRGLLYTTIFHILSNITHIAVYLSGNNKSVLCVSVIFDNITSGMMTSSFVYFIHSLCKKNTASSQYAVIWGLNYCAGSVLRPFGGALVDSVGWVNFYFFIQLLTIPSILYITSIIKKGYEL